jgi:hypothetical protein
MSPAIPRWFVHGHPARGDLLGCVQSVGRGHIDLDSGVFYRRPQGSEATKKRQTPVRLPQRLLAHLRRWKRLGIAKHAVVEWNGKPLASVRKSFEAAVVAAGIDRHITPHILRHTAATWAMQRGVNVWDAAGWLGMSPEVLERVYGPDIVGPSMPTSDAAEPVRRVGADCHGLRCSRRASFACSIAASEREIEQLSALPAGYLSGRKAEIKAFPRLKQQEGDLNSGSAEIVSLWNRK